MKDWKCTKHNTNEVWNTHTSSDEPLVTFSNPKWKSLESRKIHSKFVLFHTLFSSIKKLKKMKNLKICLWRDHIRTCDGPELFWKIVWSSPWDYSKKDFHFLKNFKSNSFDGGATEKVGFHRVCQIRVQKSEILNIWWWNTFDKIFF